ncbi:MAG: hypothetical protein ND866_04940 [Pyrinomonadaceae bacterium]|nr:hypothetical protein [Pyrinomonadaceae bacterium]
MNQLNTAASTKTAADAIRPFHVNFPEAALVDLRRRPLQLSKEWEL